LLDALTLKCILYQGHFIIFKQMLIVRYFLLAQKVTKKGPAIDYGPMTEAAMLGSNATVTSTVYRYS
jgi:hypothetical protein